MRLAVEADSAEMAVDRLADFAAAVVETDTVSVEAFGSSLALVAAVFPEADLSAATGGPASRGTDAPEAPALRSAEAGVRDGLAVWPNPSSGVGTVQVSLSASASATVSVYDALGRRVSVLHDGALTAGAHAFGLSASRLAPGVYVVQVRVVPTGGPEAGSPWTQVRRVTVVR